MDRRLGTKLPETPIGFEGVALSK